MPSRARKFYHDIVVSDALVSIVEADLEAVSSMEDMTDYDALTLRCTGRDARHFLIPAAICEGDARRFLKYGGAAGLLGSLVNVCDTPFPNTGFFIHADKLGATRSTVEDFLSEERRKCYEWHRKIKRSG